MSKNKRKQKISYDEYDEDFLYENQNREESRKRRQQKRMKNALRTKNIDALLEYEDDY